MLHAGEFPGHFDIDTGLWRMRDIEVPIILGPAITGFKIHVPIDCRIILIYQTPYATGFRYISRVDPALQPVSFIIRPYLYTHVVEMAFYPPALHTVLDLKPTGAQDIKAMG